MICEYPDDVVYYYHDVSTDVKNVVNHAFAGTGAKYLRLKSEWRCAIIYIAS